MGGMFNKKSNSRLAESLQTEWDDVCGVLNEWMDPMSASNSQITENERGNLGEGQHMYLNLCFGCTTLGLFPTSSDLSIAWINDSWRCCKGWEVGVCCVYMLLLPFSSPPTLRLFIRQLFLFLVFPFFGEMLLFLGWWWICVPACSAVFISTIEVVGGGFSWAETGISFILSSITIPENQMELQEWTCVDFIQLPGKIQAR